MGETIVGNGVSLAESKCSKPFGDMENNVSSEDMSSESSTNAFSISELFIELVPDTKDIFIESNFK